MQYLKDLLHNTNIDFVSKRSYFGVISLVMVVVSWVVFIGIGPNWGIDFTGGTEIHLRFVGECADADIEEEAACVDASQAWTPPSIQISEIRQALRALGLSDDAVQQVGSDVDFEYVVRIQDATFGSEAKIKEVQDQLNAAFGKDGEDWVDPARTTFDAEVGARLVVGYNGSVISPASVAQALGEGALVHTGKVEKTMVINLPGLATEIEGMLADALSDDPFIRLSSDAVGPKVGGELRRQGFISVFATLGLVLLYVAFRFDLVFAPGAIIALIHDVSIVVGIFVLLRLEFNLPMIGALLTIVGYSLNDTIVIYDRIRENRDRYSRTDTHALINVSINETLARTLATSVTTFLAISAFLVFGGPVIRNFALAMLLGIVFGTYSTVYVASPMVLVMEDLRPFFSKFVAVSAATDDLGDREPTAEELLSESEKRRRARAAGDQGPAA
jgi:preprotein translocase subunit SecF